MRAMAFSSGAMLGPAMGAAGLLERAGLLEKAGYTLVLFASITFVTIVALSILAVFSFVEPYYSIPELVDTLLPIALLGILALVAGTVAVVASKVLGEAEEPLHAPPGPPDSTRKSRDETHK